MCLQLHSNSNFGLSHNYLVVAYFATPGILVRSNLLSCFNLVRIILVGNPFLSHSAIVVFMIDTIDVHVINDPAFFCAKMRANNVEIVEILWKFDSNIPPVFNICPPHPPYPGPL